MLASMMFMMPIPPTRSDTAAMLAKRVVSVRVPSCWALAISVRLRIWKSSSASGLRWWRSRSSARTRRSVRAVASDETALTKTDPAM